MEILKYFVITDMSTIIIPGGGGMGLGIASLIGNVIALVLLIGVVKYFWKNVQLPDKPVNITEELLKYNVDASGLFAGSPSPQKETYVRQRTITSADVFATTPPLIEAPAGR